MRTSAGLGVLIACFAAAGDAAAQNYCELEKIHVRAEGDGVSAEFSSVDTSTCALGVETTVHVDGSQGIIHVADYCGRGGNRVSTVTSEDSSVVAVVVTVHDRCLDMDVLSVTGTGVPEEFHVHPNRKTASLRATFEGTDDADLPVSIAIDLVWNGVGRKDSTSEHVSNNQGIFKVVFTSFGTVRDAVAAGSVEIDGSDRTPLPSTRGTIEKDALRQLIVYR